MDTILRVIDDVTNDRQVKSIINSLNENQVKSKNWLIDKSKDYLSLLNNPKICIAAGWYGHLANKLEKYTDQKIVSFDKDPMTKKIGKKLYPDIWFKVEDIKEFSFKKFDVVICTSCEHLEQKLLDSMLDRVKPGALVILQSNNYFEIEDHINCQKSLDDFNKSIKLYTKLYTGILKLDKYDRYMIIGTKKTKGDSLIEQLKK
tara:strand:- start:513 stop:1121 length:609 start_codon:yes stop_codon:yes gene_type:complete